MVTRCHKEEIAPGLHPAGAARHGSYVWWRTSAADGMLVSRVPTIVLTTTRLTNRLLYQVISFALYNLCKHPEYIEPLTNEIIAMEESSKDGQRNYDDLPLMDSFLKETARLNPTMIREWTPTITTERGGETRVPCSNLS